MKRISLVALLVAVGVMLWGTSVLAGEKFAELKIGSVLSL
jgi:hypothetical protein